MILDRHNQFSVKQAITASAPSTDTIDLGPVNNVGTANGADDLPIFISVDETFTAGGAATLRATLQSSNDVTFATGVRDHTSQEFTVGQLVVRGRLGNNFVLPEDVQRFVRFNYTVGTGPFTAGRLSAGMTTARQTNR